MPIGPRPNLLQRLLGISDQDMELPQTYEPPEFAFARQPPGPPIESDMAEGIMRRVGNYEPTKQMKKKKYAKTLKKYGRNND